MSEAGKGRYEEILTKSNFVILPRPRMDRKKRAAQFAPFDALSGYRETIGEACRRTEEDILLSEDQQAELDRRMRDALRHPEEEVVICWFEKDLRKAGGAFRRLQGKIQRNEPAFGRFQMESGEWISCRSVRFIARVDGGESMPVP